VERDKESQKEESVIRKILELKAEENFEKTGMSTMTTATER
jgi:hypothetical protein